MMIKKQDLISLIQNTATFQNPNVNLEQYTIDAVCAVDLIYFAGVEFDDIRNAVIFDLGTGSGRLSIASAFLNAYMIVSVDIDLTALHVLRSNIISLELDHIINPICADIRTFHISKQYIPKNQKITTIMNPPFGVQKKTADRFFLEKAFSFSDVVYSIHLASNKVQKFISNFINKLNWKIDYILPFNMRLEKSFEFHNKKAKIIDVNIYRFIKNE